MDVDAILRQAAQCGASDVHFTVGVPPVFRLHGLLVPQEGETLKPQDTADAIQQMAPEATYQRWQEAGEADFAYSLAGAGRFRVNAFHQRGSGGLACRLIRTSIPSLADLGLPPVLAELARRQRGLVLVTGPTGSGKSTTLAAIVDLINEERSCHILTLEDPVEFIHRHKRSMVNQREIGTDSLGFAAALRAALRQDPDVILVGEMRDLDTMATALTAAETGHLVLGTLHTGSAPQAVDRLIDGFPPHQQQQVRVQLAETLQGVVAQQLIPRRDGKGVVLALEILIVTPAVRNLVREGKSHQLVSVIQTGGRLGMQTMESSLRRLHKEGIISAEELSVRLGTPGLGGAEKEFM